MTANLSVEEQIAALRGRGSAARTDYAAVEAYIGITAQQSGMYQLVPSSRFAGVATAQARLGEHLLGRAGSAALRARLGGAVARSALLAGRIAFFDLHAPAAAAQHYRLALDAATEVGDGALASAIRTHAAFVPGFAGRGAEARATLESAFEPGPGARLCAVQRGWLHAVGAEIEGRLGGHNAARAHLDRSRELMARPDWSAVPAWLDYFDASRLDGFAGSCQLRAGEPELAAATLQAGLDALPAAAVKQHAVVLADLAEARIAQLEIVEACLLLTRALELIAEHWYATAMLRVRAVRAKLAPHAGLPAVQELDDLLATWSDTLPAQP